MRLWVSQSANQPGQWLDHMQLRTRLSNLLAGRQIRRQQNNDWLFSYRKWRNWLEKWARRKIHTSKEKWKKRSKLAERRVLLWWPRSMLYQFFFLSFARWRQAAWFFCDLARKPMSNSMINVYLMASTTFISKSYWFSINSEVIENWVVWPIKPHVVCVCECVSMPNGLQHALSTRKSCLIDRQCCAPVTKLSNHLGD